MKYYFYAPSYVTLREYFYLKHRFQNVTLVSGHEDLVKLARYMQWDIIDCCAAGQPLKNRSANTFKRLIQYWKRNNDTIDFVVSNINNGTFYFQTLLIDLWGLKLVQRLSQKKNVEIIYLDNIKITSRYQQLKRVNLSYRYLQVYNMLLYLLPFKWFDTGGGYYLGVDQSFLKKYGITHDRSMDPFYSIVEGPSVCSTVPIEVLIIGGVKLDENKTLLNPEDIKTVYRFIKKVQPNTYFKYHPGNIAHDEVSDSFKQVEPFIPVEFLHKTIKMAIGDFSFSLINLSLRGVQCVSYLNLIETNPNYNKDFWVRLLTEGSKGRIRFVNSFDELAAMLKT